MTAADEPVREEPTSRTEPTSVETPSEKKPPMEIHPPHGPIHTKKDFFVHLLTIIAGILIALSLEGLITWGHDRALVREARANLALEIRHNKQIIDRAVDEIEGRRKGLVRIIQAMQELEAGRPVTGKLEYTFIGYDLYSTAWATAASSGATAHMDYDDLKRYTDLYNTQQLFMTLQFDGFRATTDISDLGWIMERDLKTLSKARLEQIETAAARYITILDTLAGAARQLSQQYAAFEER
jgi:hypothetical protein